MEQITTVREEKRTRRLRVTAESRQMLVQRGQMCLEQFPKSDRYEVIYIADALSGFADFVVQDFQRERKKFPSAGGLLEHYDRTWKPVEVAWLQVRKELLRLSTELEQAEQFNPETAVEKIQKVWQIGLAAKPRRVQR